MDKLMKPCPFCESEDIVIIGDWFRWYGQCPECCTRGPIEKSREKAAVAWNDRPREAVSPITERSERSE